MNPLVEEALEYFARLIEILAEDGSTDETTVLGMVEDNLGQLPEPAQDLIADIEDILSDALVEDRELNDDAVKMFEQNELRVQLAPKDHEHDYVVKTKVGRFYFS